MWLATQFVTAFHLWAIMFISVHLISSLTEHACMYRPIICFFQKQFFHLYFSSFFMTPYYPYALFCFVFCLFICLFMKLTLDKCNMQEILDKVNIETVLICISRGQGCSQTFQMREGGGKGGWRRLKMELSIDPCTKCPFIFGLNMLKKKKNILERVKFSLWASSAKITI